MRSLPLVTLSRMLRRSSGPPGPSSSSSVFSLGPMVARLARRPVFAAGGARSSMERGRSAGREDAML